MITWMQRHKKWLVITVWISTIAFVGAGFVGWGSYDYGKSSGNVATVGSKEIQVSDLQSEYNTLYSQYQNAFGEAFNQEMAKQFKLEEAAYTKVVQKFILLNYADELGLYITDNEIAKYLVQIPAFLKDGKFDKNTYLSVLKQNRKNPTDFENQLKTDLLVNKVQTVISTSATTKEIENVAKLYLAQDKVSVSIINKAQFKIDSSNSSIKKYWESHKENYKSLESIKIAMTKVVIGDNKKQSKKDALKKYLKLKKGDEKFTSTLTIDANNNSLLSQNIEKISKESVGTILKPLENNKEYIVVKVIEKQAPTTLSFDKALVQVKQDYLANAKDEQLNLQISKLTKNFNGTNIGFISSTSTQLIGGLDAKESNQLVQHIFNSQTQINSIVLGDKAVVYKITDSRFTDSSSAQTTELTTLLNNLKNSEVVSNLLKQLQNRYEVVSNMKAN